jgi:hypothetical protein
MIAQVNPAIMDEFLRFSLCRRSYPGHRNGCPNYGKKKGCPPGALPFGQVYDLTKPVYAIYNAFPIGEHVARMRELHPEWSDRQLYCCLYWQPQARKQLRDEISRFNNPARHELFAPINRVTVCPEAMGVNVTHTMARIGVDLEWPPRIVAYQVALAAVPRKDADRGVE